MPYLQEAAFSHGLSGSEMKSRPRGRTVWCRVPAARTGTSSPAFVPFPLVGWPCPRSRWPDLWTRIHPFYTCQGAPATEEQCRSAADLLSMTLGLLTRDGKRSSLGLGYSESEAPGEPPGDTG